MSLKKNVIANYLGQGWSAIMGLAFLPLYIKYLGVESYGLIGLFAVMQAWLTLLDMGMTPTLNREMARYTAGAHTPQSIRNLLLSLEIVCFSIAAVIALSLWLGSGYIANDWLKSGQLSTVTVQEALSIMALIMALRFCEGIYRGALYGLQKHVLLNAVNALLATMRHGGAVGIVIYISPTIEAFFYWQALLSFASLLCLGIIVHRQMPVSPLAPKFSRAALAEISQFAIGMTGMSLLAVMSMQVDKVLLSKLLSLEAFGYYMLAVSIAAALNQILSPVTQAIYPRMVELVTHGESDALSALYHRFAQLITVLTAPVTIVIMLFAEPVLYVWSGNAQLASAVAPILAIMILGGFLNGLMHIPHDLQIAHGYTRLIIKAGLYVVIVTIPAIIWVVPRFGAVGAAWIWAGLNAGYVILSIHQLHNHFLPKEKYRWYYADVFLPVAGSVVVGATAYFIHPIDMHDRLTWFIFLLGVGMSAFIASMLLAGLVRQDMLGRLRWLLHKRLA